jgi:DNA-binding NtrC family response regulator
MGLRYILIVGSHPDSCLADNCRRLSELIRSSPPFAGMQCQTATSFPPKRRSVPPGLILFRHSSLMPLPEALHSLRIEWNHSPILGLFCAGAYTSSDISHALLNGLDDFLCCPFTEIDLVPRIRRLLPGNTERAGSSAVKATTERLNLESLVGEGVCFLRAIGKIPLLARADTMVLISGETGTGKELFARAIHYHSPRKDKPFIPVNCGALPDHLFENELFGHAKGAFTDASSAEKGLITEAEGGTLFLDEVDTLSAAAQIKLLRFLQDQMYRPLGSSKSIVADVRIIAATNADLRKRVETNLFREDLYYRINVLSLRLPPLRERIEDIPLLAAHFLTRYGSQYGHRAVRLSSGALQKLLVYPWPGNVRELESVLQRAVILTSSPTLRPDDIDLPSPCHNGMAEGGVFRDAKTQVIEQFERAYLTDLLAAHEGNVTRAAKSAGKERRAFQRLLRKYDLDRCAFQT